MKQQIEEKRKQEQRAKQQEYLMGKLMKKAEEDYQKTVCELAQREPPRQNFSKHHAQWYH